MGGRRVSESKVERGDAIFSGVMIGVWLAVAAMGVLSVVRDAREGEFPLIGLLVLAISLAWIARHVVKIIDYIKQ